MTYGKFIWFPNIDEQCRIILQFVLNYFRLWLLCLLLAGWSAAYTRGIARRFRPERDQTKKTNKHHNANNELFIHDNLPLAKH